MKKVLEAVSIFIVVFVIIMGITVTSFKIGEISANHSSKSFTDTVTVVRIDTILFEKVVPKQVTFVKTIRDTLYSTDTVLTEVYVPINRYVFQDTLYRAEISGYRVSLDKMEVFNREVTNTVTNTVIKRVPKRWGLGVSAGYSFTPQGFQPYIGVGVNYNVISF